MWGIVLNYVNDEERHGVAVLPGFETKRVWLTDMYEASVMVGDMYESYAILVFGRLVLHVLHQHISVRQNALHAEGCHLPHGSTSVEDLNGAVNSLKRQMKGLALLGIKLFCLTCLGQGAYQLLIVSAEYYREYYTDWQDTIEQALESKQHAHWFFYGAGFMSSFAAIGNLIDMEQVFHHALEDFGTFLKFWGTKVLVSVAFLQYLALEAIPPFSRWTETRRSLLYCSLLCFQCFLVSIMHLSAWSPDEGWYKYGTDVNSDDESSQAGSDDSPGGSHVLQLSTRPKS